MFPFEKVSIMDVRYMWIYILTRIICCQLILLKRISFNGQFVHLVGMEGNVVIIVILAICEHNFMRVHKNMAQHPSNNIDY